MKARHIKKLRKRISEQGYYRSRIDMLRYKLKEWHRFEQFECNPSFVGYELAAYNIDIYNKEYHRCNGKFQYYVNKEKKNYESKIKIQ